METRIVNIKYKPGTDSKARGKGEVWWEKAQEDLFWVYFEESHEEYMKTWNKIYAKILELPYKEKRKKKLWTSV